MKNILSFAAFLLAFVASSWAYDFSAVSPSGHTLYYSINAGTNTVCVTYPNASAFENLSNPWDGYTKPTGALTIPSTVTNQNQTYPVTSIGHNAFYNCSGLTAATIPNSATSIEHSAFYRWW